jgi:tRNA G18 (ribose-2'-O)-methylase SpoU
MREQTRVQRYKKKLEKANFLPIQLVTVEFELACNLGLVVRSAACFGVKTVHVIGHKPEYRKLRETSGSTSLFVDVIQHSSPSEFLKWQKGKGKLVSLELTEDSKSLYEFSATEETFLVVGHETHGIPVEILKNSDEVYYIPMPGLGFCLNTALTSHLALYEIRRPK